LKRALDNLIFNALIHNSENAKVHITLMANNSITIKIDDNGKGMDSAELDSLFERYYRGTNTTRTEGTGLGMAIAKQIVELHGGSILVESELGKGTCVTVDLPLAN
jgi:signal transduction histidine kinase